MGSDLGAYQKLCLMTLADCDFCFEPFVGLLGFVFMQPDEYIRFLVFRYAWLRCDSSISPGDSFFRSDFAAIKVWVVAVCRKACVIEYLSYFGLVEL